MIDSKSQREIDALADALVAIEETQNKVSITEFGQYKALFIASTINTMSTTDIRLLSTRFVRRFNPYRAIEVYDTDGSLLFKIPQLFVQIKDVDRQYTGAVDKFRSEGVSEVPKYSSEATQGLLVAIMKSQLDVDSEGFETYSKYISSLSEQYIADLKLFNQNKTIGEKNADDKETNNNSVDQFDGLSWE